jgi:hypothetical protein
VELLIFAGWQAFQCGLMKITFIAICMLDTEVLVPIATAAITTLIVTASIIIIHKV